MFEVFASKTTKQISDLQNRLEAEASARKTLAAQVGSLTQVQRSTPPAAVSNQLWNGELGHSVNSWHDSAYTTDEKSMECAWFFSHDAMTVGQDLELIDARIDRDNTTLKSPDHTYYDINYSDWDRQRGQARLQKLSTVDTPLPQNSVEAGMTGFASLIAARRNSYIEIPETLRFCAGLFDDTAGQNDWLKGSVGLAASPSDGTGSTERRYVLFIETDRGYSILSQEVTVAAGYSDAQFAAGKVVNLSWHNAAGYLRVQVWRLTPSTGRYEYLEEVSSGAATYADNNTVKNVTPVPTGYPVGSETERKALYVTTSGNMVNLTVDGGTWTTIKCPIGVPDNYDKALTTDRQWLRFFTTQTPNLFITGIDTDGTDLATHADAVFEDPYAALFPGLAYEIYDSSDALLASGFVLARPGSDTLQLDATIPAGADRKLRIVAGGFHGILMDKIHFGFQDNVSFAPNPLDARELGPVAAPSSGQGGTVGDGGPYGGGGLCVVRDTPVRLAGFFESDGETAVQNLTLGYHVDGENGSPNTVMQLDSGWEYTRVVRTGNGFEIECSESHRFKMNAWDKAGKPLCELRVGDYIETKVDGRREMTPIAFIGPRSAFKKEVFTPRLRDGVYYVAGRWRPTRWQRILIALGLMKPKIGGTQNHNRKPTPPDP